MSNQENEHDSNADRALVRNDDLGDGSELPKGESAAEAGVTRPFKSMADKLRERIPSPDPSDPAHIRRLKRKARVEGPPDHEEFKTQRDREGAAPERSLVDALQEESIQLADIRPVGFVPALGDLDELPGPVMPYYVTYSDGTTRCFAAEDPKQPFIEVQPGIWTEPGIVIHQPISHVEPELDIGMTLGVSNGALGVSEISILCFSGVLTPERLGLVSVQAALDAFGWCLFYSNPNDDALSTGVFEVLQYPMEGVRAAKYGPNDDALTALATIYKVATALGRPPAIEVANELQITRPTAGRWISKAREKGYLLPATRNQHARRKPQGRDE